VPAHHDHRSVAIAPARPGPRGAWGATPIGGRCPRRRAPGAGQAARTTGTRCSAGSTGFTVGPQRSVPTVGRTAGHDGFSDADPRRAQ
jgi:hypothetical protein